MRSDYPMGQRESNAVALGLGREKGNENLVPSLFFSDPTTFHRIENRVNALLTDVTRFILQFTKPGLQVAGVAAASRGRRPTTSLGRRPWHNWCFKMG